MRGRIRAGRVGSPGARGWAEAEGRGLRRGERAAGWAGAALAGRVGRTKPRTDARLWACGGGARLRPARRAGLGSARVPGANAPPGWRRSLAGVPHGDLPEECSCGSLVGCSAGKAVGGGRAAQMPRTKWARGLPPPSLLAVRATGPPQVARALRRLEQRISGPAQPGWSWGAGPGGGLLAPDRLWYSLSRGSCRFLALGKLPSQASPGYEMRCKAAVPLRSGPFQENQPSAAPAVFPLLKKESMG